MGRRDLDGRDNMKANQTVAFIDSSNSFDKSPINSCTALERYKFLRIYQRKEQRHAGYRLQVRQFMKGYEIDES